MDLLKNIPKGDKVIWIIFFCLCLISIIEVFSTASTLTYKSDGHRGPITQHSIIPMIGTIVVVLMHNISYKWFQVFPVLLCLISVVLLAFVTLMGVITGDRVNEAARWTSFMGSQFQSSELAKMAIIIAVPFIFSKKQDDEGASPKAFKHIMTLTGLVCVLIAPENLLIAMLLFRAVVLMTFIGHVAFKKLAMLLGGLALAGCLGVIFLLAAPEGTDIPFLHRSDTWKGRVANFIEKEEVPTAKFDVDKDVQIAHARIAIATSNMIGKAPGNSVQRDFLSQAFSDSISAIIVEGLGLVGGAFVVIFHIRSLVRTDRITQKREHTSPAFFVMGIALMLVSQAILNMMVAVGLFPVTGQPLPLISKGGASTLINCAYIGTILGVSHYTAYLEEKKDNPTPLLTGEEGSETVANEAQTAVEPTAEALNSDAKFEE